MAEDSTEKPAPKRTRAKPGPKPGARKTASAASAKPAAATRARKTGAKAATARTTASRSRKAAPKGRTEAWREQAGAFADQAKTTARSAANTAKNSTGSALHGLSKLISDTAGTVDSRLGPQYGDYARLAAETVASAAKSLDDADIDKLAEDARDFVRKSPAVAIGAAAVVGFVLMRLARGGGGSSDET